MKISIRDVQVGRFFVKSYSVREITKDLGDQVQYRSYDFETGDLFPDLPGRCSKEHITRWAGREATPEEIARMKRVEADAVESQVAENFTLKLLDAIPDEVLIAEMHRRGLTL